MIYLKAERKGGIFSGITWLIESKSSLFHNYYDLTTPSHHYNKASALLKLTKDIRTHGPFYCIVLDHEKETQEILLSEASRFDKDTANFLSAFFKKHDHKIIHKEVKCPNIYEQILVYREIVKEERITNKKSLHASN